MVEVPRAVHRDSVAAGLQRWLVLTQYYPPETGAPQIRLRCFVRELRRNGKHVVVNTAMPNYPIGKIFKGYRGRIYCKQYIDSVEIRRVWAYAATGKSAFARLLNYCSFAINVLPIVLLSRKPDVVFVEAQPLPLGIVALLMKRIRGVPYIYNVPDLQVDVARELGFLRHAALLRLAERLETLLLKNSMSVSTVTDNFVRHFEQRGITRSRITFLPNGADTDFLRPRQANSELIETWGIQQKLAVVYLGTHAYYHGLDTLVDAAELLKSDPRIRIVMIGNGPERQRIRELAASKHLANIVFGEASYEKTAEVYSVTYAAVATLRNIPVAEGMRLSKIFPALSCGVPVIYSGKGEAAQLLTTHQCGVVVPPEDPLALAEAIQRLASSPLLRNKLGANGRRYVEHEYSWSTIVNRWLSSIEHPSLTSPINDQKDWELSHRASSDHNATREPDLRVSREI